MPESLCALAASLFDTLSWPSVADEPWRRTDLSRLLPSGMLDEAAAWEAPEIVSDTPKSPLLPPEYSARIITESGWLRAINISEEARSAGLNIQWVSKDDLPENLELMGRDELEENPDRINVWHWKDLSGALIIRVPDNVSIDLPVIVEERLINRDGTNPRLNAAHLHLMAGKNSELSVIWSFEGSPAISASAAAPVMNPALSADVLDNAHLDIALRQRIGKNLPFFMNSRIRGSRDSRCSFTETHFGASLIKTRVRAVLDGEGSDARLNGLYVVNEGQHIDLGTLQEHRSAHATSNALYKGAVRPGGHGIFQGLIEVYPKAVKTDAYLTNNNLILGNGARTDSIPQLNILTDDVRCSHGSTTGKLDDAQLFYLQSRLFSPQEAERELTRAFLSVVIDSAPEALRFILSEDLEQVLLEHS